jgi:hypothetical protein
MDSIMPSLRDHWERVLGTCSILGWMGPGAGVEVLRRDKSLSPDVISASYHPAHAQSLYWVCCPRFLHIYTADRNV